MDPSAASDWHLIDTGPKDGTTCCCISLGLTLRSVSDAGCRRCMGGQAIGFRI
jgi:hypothetical protein